jgi:CheY-like chemotaxis protein
MPLEHKPPLLLVEDEQDDVIIIKQAIEKAGFGLPVQEARNGEDAMHYLAGDGRFADREQFPLPFLVLLDLKMPGWNGFDFLQWLQYRSDLNHLPVVVLTSSGLDDDVRKAFALGAKSYLMKPSDLADLQDLMRLLKKYWPVLKDTVVVQREDTP